MTAQVAVENIIALVTASRDEEAIAFWERLDPAVRAQMDAQQLDTALAYLASATYSAEANQESRFAHVAD